MQFTREPIIETVITPREGSKLVVRNSKGNGQEDYYVEAVEVVSFGHSFFFRSLEKPKCFLVPVSDYEILELRETRMVLKSVSSERSIKIGGGRETPPPRGQYRETRESLPVEEPVREEAPLQEEVSQPEGAPQEPRMDRGKRDRRRRGRRGGRDRGPDMRSEQRPASQVDVTPTEGPEMNEEAPAFAPESEEPKAAPSFISKLFPPPPTLIKETLGRYKLAETMESASPQESFSEKSKEAPFEPPFPSDEGSSDHSEDEPNFEN